MIAVDTNIVVRLLTRDDESQYQAAYTLFRQDDIYMTKTVVLEAEWVLRYAYEFSSDEIIAAFRGMFGLANVELEDEDQITIALEWHARGLDFADALHLAGSHRSQRFATFDRRLAAVAGSFSTITVTIPE